MRAITVGLLIATLLFSSCSTNEVDGHGSIVSESLNLTGFTSIDLSLPAKLYYTEGAEYSVEVFAQQNILAILDFEKSGNRLNIGLTKGFSLGSFKPIRINITSPEVTSLSINGAGEILAENAIHTTKLTLRINGSGEFEVDEIVVDELVASIDGSGKITVFSGSTTEEELTITGSGTLNFAGAPSKNSKVNIGGSGTVRVNAIDNLNVTISGSGTVFYKGSPNISTTISGSGKLVKIN